MHATVFMQYVKLLKIITNWIIKMLEILCGSVLMHFIITNKKVR